MTMSIIGSLDIPDTTGSLRDALAGTSRLPVWPGSVIQVLLWFYPENCR